MCVDCQDMLRQWSCVKVYLDNVQMCQDMSIQFLDIFVPRQCLGV